MRLLSTKIQVFLVFFLVFAAPVHAKNSQTSSITSYKKSSFNMYSQADEPKIGAHYMALQIEAMKKEGVGVDLPKHQKLKSRLEGIVRKLAVVSDNPGLPYEVHIFDKPDVVNAFCMPGGKMGVFTGLFDSQKGLVDINNDDQIAAVMAHEIAHATLRHVTRQVTKMQGVGFLGTVASVAIGQGVGGNAQQLFNQVFSLGANIYFPKYSRQFEKDSDQAGMYYMSRAGYQPQSAIDIWQRAAARGGSGASKTSVFASHPANGERAKNLQKWLPEAQKIYEEAKLGKKVR